MRSIDYFDRGHDLDPLRTCIVDGDKRFSFAAIKKMTEQCAQAMYANGFQHQNSVALYSPNSAEVMIALLSIWRANGKWIPVNTRNAIDANVAYLNYVRCEWLFYHSSLAADVKQLQQRVSSLKYFVCLDQNLNGDISLEAFIQPHDSENFVDGGDPFGNLDDIVGIFPTGGTTGPSKGVNVTNLGWGTMIETAGQMLAGRTDNPVTLVSAPITHAAGPVSLATLALGATQVILPGFNAENVLRTIAEHHVTHMYLPPTALYSLLDSPELAQHDTRSLKLFLLVGSPVSPQKLRRAVEVFGPCLCQCYGQVECPMVISWLPPEVAAAAARGEHAQRLASCGRPTASVRVGIMDQQGRLLPTGERGEIVVRGALVSHSYFEKPEATEEIRAFGWHHTGDVGYRDPDGYIYIVDRLKDMIVTGGFNVFSAEVEAAVTELSAVKECAVFGVPHEKWGEAVHAVVVATGVSAEQIIAHAKQKLGGVKAPKTIAFIDSIPRTAAGKPDKKALRDPYWKQSGGDGGRMVN